VIATRSWLLLGTSGLAVIGAGVGLAAIVRPHHAPAPAPPVDPAPPTPAQGTPPRILPRVASSRILDEPLRQPDDLTRRDIFAAMGRVKPRAETCLAEVRDPAPVDVRLTIANNGRVTAAKVQGKLAGTDTAECVESAARAATFRTFKKPMITLTWPFMPPNPTAPAEPAQ
jgi:hypothetical protein